ncbi:MAG: hypothetical protein K2X74_00940 [Acetobacteraceae bacterium]|nr:hypothetical protein [Acetobacteraceae bacterium]
MVPRPQARWPAALALLVLLLLIQGLPDHYRVWPGWAGYLVFGACLASMAGVALGGGGRRWLDAERVVVGGTAALVIATQAYALVVLIGRVIGPEEASDGLALLTSAVAIWACNVVGFALLFWQLDSGGPRARLEGGGQPDWLFVEQANPEAVPPDWRPGFVDYLFLGFSTATAFSTTDMLPLTPRAKLLMMAEAMISLVTLAVVAARAINVLG